LRMVGKPNADRYDEMTADGTDFGHIAYPIYVFSRSRWAQATTPEFLERSRINYTLVVPEDEHTYYYENYPTANILMLPKNIKGIRAARQHIYERAKEEGYPNIWMLDDDIQAAYSNGKQVTARAVMSTLERLNEDYSNVSMIGASGLDEEHTKKFNVNRQVRGLMLVNMMTSVEFNGKENIYEDIVFALKNLKKGYVTIVHNEYQIEYAEMMGGGISYLYTKGKEVEKTVEKINETYPAWTSVVNTNPPENLKLVVEWSSITVPVKSRNVQLLMEGK